MIITATIDLERKQLETILAEGSHIGNLKAIADQSFGIELEWLDDSKIQISGKMWSITMIAEAWHPVKLELISYTEDDEL